jgi:anhydro-N-acetylmuramic acid kinase
MGLLARETGIDVVYDMRANDMVHGGQGAPLIPVYHAALSAESSRGRHAAGLFRQYRRHFQPDLRRQRWRAVCYDSGPGNMLIDQWVEAHTGRYPSIATGDRQRGKVMTTWRIAT